MLYTHGGMVNVITRDKVLQASLILFSTVCQFILILKPSREDEGKKCFCIQTRLKEGKVLYCI